MITTNPPPSELTLKFRNATSARPEGYWPVTIRKDVADKLGSKIDFVSNKGVTNGFKVRDLGVLGTLYDVWVPFNAHEEATGTIRASDSADVVPEFQLHPWCGDDIVATLPNVNIRLSDDNPLYYLGEFQMHTYDEITKVRTTPTRNTWYFRGRPQNSNGKYSGFVVHYWATLKSNSPVIDIRMSVCWADPTNPEPNIFVDYIYLVTGENVKFDFDTRNGHDDAPSFKNGKWWTPIVTGVRDFNGTNPGNIGMADGVGIPITGRMLCVPQVNPLTNLDRTLEPKEVEYAEAQGIPVSKADVFLINSVELLSAGAQEPIYGLLVDRGWDGHFAGMGHIGRMSNSPPATASQLLDAISNPSPNGHFNVRPIGISQSPGQTGDQEDFGVVKGTLATQFDDVRWIHYAMYSVVIDAARGFLYHESDGTPLNHELHPNWTTWSQMTHWHHGQSPDRLGKRDRSWGENRASDYWPYDDQHRSQNNLAAAYLLTGDDFLEWIIERCATNDAAHVRIRNNFGYGAPRASGRRGLTWANFYMLTDPNGRANKLFKDVLDWNVDLMPYFNGDHNNGDVDILYPGRDNRYGLKWPGTNHNLHNWVVWEHALMCYGLLACYRATEDQAFLNYAKRISKTIVKYGYYKQDGQWEACNNVWYPVENSDFNPADQIPGWIPADVGKPIPPNLYSNDSWAVTRAKGSGLETWTFGAGVTTYLATHDATDDSWNNALEIVEQVTGGEEATSTRASEWWAVINGVSNIPVMNNALNIPE